VGVFEEFLDGFEFGDDFVERRISEKRMPRLVLVGVDGENAAIRSGSSSTGRDEVVISKFVTPGAIPSPVHHSLVDV